MFLIAPESCFATPIADRLVYSDVLMTRRNTVQILRFELSSGARVSWTYHNSVAVAKRNAYYENMSGFNSPVIMLFKKIIFV